MEGVVIWQLWPEELRRFEFSEVPWGCAAKPHFLGGRGFIPKLFLQLAECSRSQALSAYFRIGVEASSDSAPGADKSALASNLEFLLSV